MIKLKARYEILDEIDNKEVLKKIEKIGRVCYKSEDRITETSAFTFVENLIKKNHESVLEHFSFSIKFIVDRALSHEIVRHRIASYAQESQRYCNYALDKFNAEITVIEPDFYAVNSQSYLEWENACKQAETSYFNQLNEGLTPEMARTVLPNCTKTEIVMSANLRTWRHFLKLRTSKSAHPQMRQLARKLLKELQIKLPSFFSDITED